MVRGSHKPAQPGQKFGHHPSAIRPVLTTSGYRKGGMAKVHHHRVRKHKAGGVAKFHKGSKSRTMKGRKDFTTKKSSKVFHQKGHYVRKARKPYHK